MTSSFKITTKTIDAIRRLLNNKFVLRTNGEKAFQSICDLRNYLEDYFEQMGADLVIDDALGVAYLLETENEKSGSSSLSFGRKTELAPIETMAVLFLRQKRLAHLSDVKTMTDSATITSDELRTHLIPYSELGEGKLYQKKFEATLERLRELQIVTVNQDTTFTITPICDLILPVEKVAAINIAAEKYFARRNGETATAEEAT